MPSTVVSGAIHRDRAVNRKPIRWALFALLIAAIGIAIAYRNQFDAIALEQWIQDAGGALFGPVVGTLYNLTGATIGATLAFLVARYLASEWVEQKTGGRLKQLKEGIESEGWRFVAFVRLVPLFPFNLLNYALGLTRIKLWHYVVASYLCMLPGAIAYTYLGYAGREAIAGSEGLIQKGLLALALLATVAFLPRLIKHLRRAPMLSVQALKAKLDQGEDVFVLDVRTAADFVDEQGHIQQAHNIPVEDLSRRINELTEYRDRPIAIVCRTDKRSLKAAKLLSQKSFAEVHVVKGGMTEWNRLGYNIQR